MIFLIEYNRPQGRIVTFKSFNDEKRVEAQDARLHLELKLRDRMATHEVVLLEATSEEVLRKAYQRYFEDVSQIGKSAIRGDAA